jgi:hypothetical protein
VPQDTALDCVVAQRRCTPGAGREGVADDDGTDRARLCFGGRARVACPPDPTVSDHRCSHRPGADRRCRHRRDRRKGVVPLAGGGYGSASPSAACRATTVAIAGLPSVVTISAQAGAGGPSELTARSGRTLELAYLRGGTTMAATSNPVRRACPLTWLHARSLSESSHQGRNALWRRGALRMDPTAGGP